MYYYSIFKDNDYKNLFNLNLNQKTTTEEGIFNKFSSKYKIDYINYFDTRYWLTNESNYKLDKCSMINSVEARVPFQDADLITKFFFTTNQKKFSLLNRKYLLKNINVLPKYILNRPKIGWFSPDRIFLDTHLESIIKDFFDEKKIKKQNIFNYHNLINFFKQYKIQGFKIKRQLITIILFQIWYDKIINLV